MRKRTSTALLLAALSLFINYSLSQAVTASDCVDGVNVCTDLSFQIDPNGEGSNTNEIPASGTVGNPLYDGFTTYNPWGTNNFGCLQIGESNSTWMYVNISGGGNLEFTFGGGGTQTGFYDWIMYPANIDCATIAAGTTAPVRCNWNNADNGGTGLAATPPVGGDTGNYEPPLNVNAGEIYIICFSNYSSVTTSVPLQFGGTATVSCTPLPVELLSFNAILTEERQIRLRWATISEKENDFFSIERSEDGVNFESIGFVEGVGNSTELEEYGFMDDHPVPGGISYYRLKQVDNSGEFEYSNVAAVDVPMEDLVEVYPNPSYGSLIIRTGVEETSMLSVKLTNLSGRVIYQDRIQVMNGKADVDLNMINPGVYTIEVTGLFNVTYRKKLMIK